MFQGAYHSIEKSDWPVLARKLAATLKSGDDITETTSINNFGDSTKDFKSASGPFVQAIFSLYKILQPKK